MENQENSINIPTNDHHEISAADCVEGLALSMTRIIEGGTCTDTYPISDNDSATDSVYIADTNAGKLPANHDEQGELNHSMSQDSLAHGEEDPSKHNSNQPNSPHKSERPTSAATSKMSSKMSTIKSTTNGLRSLALDEHIKLVKQKKEEAEVLRLQKFQEQLRKKEQKWQQQQLERVKKWLQLRNRDTDHRTQVEERRKKREEEAKAKIDEILRREKEREQRVSQNLKPTATHKPESMMSVSTDVLSTRRATSASRSHTNHSDMFNRRGLYELSDDSSAPREEALNGECHRRPTTTTTRQHLNETIARLAKPRAHPMAQSIHVGASGTSSGGMPMSRSSHQIRLTTSTTNATPSSSANIRKRQPSRPATVPTSTNESRTSPVDDSAHSDHPSLPKPSAQRSAAAQSKAPFSSTKPLVISTTHPRAPAPRSLMTTSHSSSSLSSAITASAKRRPAAATSKPKATAESQPIATNHDEAEEEVQPVNEEVACEPMDAEPINPGKREPVTVDEQEYQRKLNQKIREAQQRLELERQREEEQKRQLELEEFEREQEQIRLVEEQRRAEQERLQRAIEERERENELKRQEEQRLQQQREELERKQAEETERLNRERQERAKKEEEERNERKKRLDLIMRRTRQVSPTSKQELNANKPPTEQTNGHGQPACISSPTSALKSPLPHSISDTHFPTSASTDNFLLTQETMTSSTTDAPKFKSPLIQSLLNKARNTRSTDSLVQTSMTASQIMTESMIEESLSTGKSSTPVDLSDDDHHENARITSASNGHGDLHLPSPTGLNSYHDRPRETATASQ